jgi:hypothetical protein
LARKKESNQRKKESPSTLHISNTQDFAPKRRRTKVPDDFSVTEKMRDWAIKNGFSDQEIQDQTELMIDTFRGSGNPKSDWVATWRVWLRNSRNGRFNGNGRGQTKVDRTIANSRRFLSRLHQQDRVSSERGAERGDDCDLHGTLSLDFDAADESGDDPHD